MRKILFPISILVVLAACSQQPANDCAYSGGKPVKGLEVVTATAPAGDLTLRSVCFVNNGKNTVSIDAIETSPISVEGTEVWSFQDGFYQRNYLGMNASDYGGGIPMVSIWNKDACVSVGLAEPVLRLVSMPVSRKGNVTRASIRQEFSEPVKLAPGDTLFALKQFVIESQGDFFQPLRKFAGYMHDTYGWEAPVSPWGYERTFTVDEVIGTLPKVVELGFKWVDIDDGYQICEGDWTANDRIGAEGMRRMTDAVHAAGLKAKIWWAPMCADPESSIAKEHPEMLLVQQDGTHEDISWWDSWYLSPVNKYTWKYTEDLVDMFLVDWGFDGFKLDGHYLNLSAPDYNPASELSYPEEACERLPEFFAHLYGQAQADKPGCVVQLCPCGDAVNFFNVPYMNQAVASDPTSSAQIRMKRMVYARGRCHRHQVHLAPGQSGRQGERRQPAHSRKAGSSPQVGSHLLGKNAFQGHLSRPLHLWHRQAGGPRDREGRRPLLCLLRSGVEWRSHHPPRSGRFPHLSRYGVHCR